MVMENPQAKNITRNNTTWKVFSPKNHKYRGTAVTAKNRVPIRNELISQLTFSKGIRENMLLFLPRSTEGNLQQILTESRSL